VKVLFLEPPLSYRHPRIFPRHPPHYAAYAAALLEKNGHAAAILDAFMEHLTEEETVARAARERPDAVAVLPFDYTRETPMEIARPIAARLRGALPGVPIGLAGSMDEGFLRAALADGDAFDFAVVGEDERPFVDVAAALARGEAWRGVPGLLVRTEGGIASTGPGRFVDDLDALPFPAWRLVDLRRYTFIPHRFRHAPFHPILASRGCPFGCLTCKEARVAKITRFRVRSVGNVMAEVRAAVRDHGAREIQFSDATFGLKRDWVFDLCDAFEREGPRVPWSAISRVDVLDAEMLRRMGAAGCWNLLYGIESGNAETLARIGKGITLDRARETVRATRDAGIACTGSYILGLPGEDRAAVLRTIEFARGLGTDYAQFFLLKAIGQESDLARWGRLTDEWDYAPYDFRGPIFVPSAFAGVGELKALQSRAYRRFYFRWPVLRRALRELFVPGQARRLAAGAWIAARVALGR
jgi:radical SAM superfamily enzyme YgiQ (UPF0313 family)